MEKKLVDMISVVAPLILSFHFVFLGQVTEEISANFISSDGKNSGEVRIIPLKKGVLMKVEVMLKKGVYALHIHEKGECKPPDFTSAGGHYNPEGKKHGFLNPEGYHKGDLPNIHVKEDGVFSLEILLPHYSPDELYGRSIMIHEHHDDYKTDPAGGAGKRIMCAEIKPKK